MNDLKTHVTPLTRGIIWLTKDESNIKNPYYCEIDYLLDGLLTANLKDSASVSSRVIVGQNFDKPIYVYVAKEVKTAELESFVSLLKDLKQEDDVLVIDELNAYDSLKKDLKTLSGHLKPL